MQLPANFHFDPDAHVYTVGGVRWPSVTEVLKPLEDFDGVPQHLMEAAAQFGTHVHMACHLHNMGTLDWDSLDAPLVPYVQAWTAYVTDICARVVASEQQVAHAQLRYAGTLDTICEIGGELILVDIKTTAAIPKTVGPQTWAYAAAIEQPRIKRRVVQLRKDGTYRSEWLKDRRDESVFISALNIYRFRERTKHAA